MWITYWAKTLGPREDILKSDYSSIHFSGDNVPFTVAIWMNEENFTSALLNMMYPLKIIIRQLIVTIVHCVVV